MHNAKLYQIANKNTNFTLIQKPTNTFTFDIYTVGRRFCLKSISIELSRVRVKGHAQGFSGSVVVPGFELIIILSIAH